MSCIKNLICALLVFSMLLPMAPVEALELENLPKFSRAYAYFADPMDPDAPAPEPQWPQRTPSLSLNTEEYLSDPEEAGAILREGMRNRQSQVAVKFRADADIEYKTVTADILAAALAHTGQPTEGDYLARQRGLISMPASYYSSNGVNYYEISFQLEYYTTAAQEAEMDTAVAELLASLELDGMSDYEKVSAVYRWMCENITYDYDNLYDDAYKLKYTGYAALINRTAVCQGYAVLLYRLCLEMGIDSRIITGLGNGGGHAWNIVKLGSKYYNLDATWDATWFTAIGQYNYYLRCNDTFGDHVRDAEFDTAEFNAAYPMDTADYNPNSHSHAYTATVTAPTCTEQGYTTYTCDCGDSYVDDYVDAKGHTPGAEATCTTAQTCTICGEELAAAKGHSYEPVVTAPTCTEQGYTTYTCSCGDSYVDSYVDALGHTPGEAVVENEGEHGSYDLVTYCTECGEELSREHMAGYTPGDIDGDGQVNEADLTLLFQYLSDWDVEVSEDALDVNGDGAINNKDLTRLSQYLAGWDVEIH